MYPSPIIYMYSSAFVYLLYIFLILAITVKGTALKNVYGYRISNCFDVEILN